MRPMRRGRTKSTAEPQELCEQRREREISPCILWSSGLNLHIQLDVPCICGIPEQTTNHPRIEAVDFGSNCRLGISFLCLICFCFYVYLGLVFRAYYHWQICLLIWLLSSFYIYIFFFSICSFCKCVCVCFFCVILSVQLCSYHLSRVLSVLFFFFLVQFLLLVITG